MSELLPCPAGCDPDHLAIAGDELRRVLCTLCGWTGASKCDKTEAIAAWNRRAPVEGAAFDAGASSYVIKREADE